MLTERSILYGVGVFTTAAISNASPILWDKHWHRLTSNASKLVVDISSHSKEGVRRQLIVAIAKCGISEGRARITFSDESPSSIWSKGGEREPHLSIIVAERRPIPENFKLTISPHRVNATSPLVGIKSCNYLEHLLAYEEASTRGFQEAIRLNERSEIASACMANVFWEKDGELFTPSLKTGCLPGTTREFVLENIKCEEVEARIAELETADRIFLTSAGIGVVSIADFNGRSLDTSNHPLSRLLPF